MRARVPETPSPWPNCPVCGEPAESATTNTETRHVAGEIRVEHRSGGVTTWACARHPMTVYMTEDGTQVASPAPDFVVRCF